MLPLLLLSLLLLLIFQANGSQQSTNGETSARAERFAGAYPAQSPFWDDVSVSMYASALPLTESPRWCHDGVVRDTRPPHGLEGGTSAHPLWPGAREYLTTRTAFLKVNANHPVRRIDTNGQAECEGAYNAGNGIHETLAPMQEGQLRVAQESQVMIGGKC